MPEQQPLPEKWIRPEHEQRIDRLEAENARLRATVPEQQPVPDEAVRAVQRVTGLSVELGRTPSGGWSSDRAEDGVRRILTAAAPFIRAQVIRELRDAATDEGPQSAYWLAADYLERK